MRFTFDLPPFLPTALRHTVDAVAALRWFCLHAPALTSPVASFMTHRTCNIHCLVLPVPYAHSWVYSLFARTTAADFCCLLLNALRGALQLITFHTPLPVSGCACPLLCHPLFPFDFTFCTPLLVSLLPSSRHLSFVFVSYCLLLSYRTRACPYHSTPMNGHTPGLSVGAKRLRF